MSINTYKFGNMVRMSCATTKLNPATGTYDPSTPTTVTCVVQRKGQTAVVVPVVNDAVGKYHADYLPPAADTNPYVYQFNGSGDCVCASDGSFIVKASPIV